MKFLYKATNKEGEVVSGTMIANDEFELNTSLREQGMTLMSASPEGEKSWHRVMEKIMTFGTVSTAEKINFGRNLSAMLEAGLSLSRAISVMERQNKNKKFKQILQMINEDIRKGNSLSEAMSSHKRTFSSLFVSMVKAGEESGDLVQALKTVSSQMDKTYQLQKRIRGAMIYPSVIIFAMTVIGIFMLVFIVPTLTSTFQSLNVELPATTQFVITVSDLFKNNLVLLLAVFAVLGFGFYFALKTERGKRSLDFVLLHTPMVSNLVKETNAARTARTLSSLISSGVPYLQSVQITGEVVQNSYYKGVLKKVEKNIELGLSVSQVFTESDNFYPIFVGEMVAVGEETGELSEMLMRVATFYEGEVEEKTKNMSTIVEPFLMLIVGGAVGFFALSMISPMYSLVENI